MAKKAFNARLDEGLLGRLDEECRRRGVSKTAAVEDALGRWLAPDIVSPRVKGPNAVAAVAERAGLTTGADLLRERQVRLNKKMGWDQ